LVTEAGFATRKEATTALNAVLADADNGMVVQRSAITVAEYLDEWIDRVEGDWSRQPSSLICHNNVSTRPWQLHAASRTYDCKTEL
jgi:hypothetical protein